MHLYTQSVFQNLSQTEDILNIKAERILALKEMLNKVVRTEEKWYPMKIWI